MIGRKTPSKLGTALAVVCTAWLLAAGAAVAADEKPVLPPGLSPPTAENVLVDAKNLKREREIRSVIMGAFEAAKGSPDSLGLYSKLIPRDLSFREAVLIALEKNLSIERQGIAEQIARAVIAEASAVFDPVLSVSLAYSHTRTEERVENVFRFKSGTNAANQILFSEGPIESVQLNAPREAGFFGDEVTANENPPTESDQVWTSVFNVAQLLPWGPSLNLNLQVKHEPTFFILNDGAGDAATFGSYHRPWVSTLSTSFSSPIPFSRNFGPLNPNRVAEDLSRLDAQKAVWNMRAVVNDTLLQTDQGFWDLVSAAERLKAALDTRALVEDLKERTDRLFRLRLITETRKARVDGELERVKGEVETAFTALVTSSNGLTQILGVDEPLFLLPTGYLSLFESKDAVSDNPDLVVGNPSFLGAVVDVKAARLTRDSLEVQTRPDFNVSGSITVSQSNTVFGFRSIEESLNELPNPDKISMTATASFFRPIGNRAAQSALAGQRHRLRGQRLSERSVKNTLDSQFQAALIQLNSARERIKITARNRDLAEKVYERSLRFQKSRRVTEFEIIEGLRSLLTAKNDHIEAQIAAKKAESTLLATIGKLAENYGDRIAQTPADRQRLKALADDGVLKYFGAAK